MIKIFKNFLPHDEAWSMACSIDATPSNWWSTVIKHNNLKTVLHLQENVGGYRENAQQEPLLQKSVQSGAFSYKFRRTTAHKTGCACAECVFRENVLNSKKFKDFIVKNTNLKKPVLSETFTSAYYPGDFLGQHTDKKRGIAFIFNLSWKWKPEYGGLLHVANESGFQCYVPGWGDLVLLELGESGENHFVSEVTSMAPRPRIAISGWYNEGDTDA
jgi:hypothetical protein